MGVTQALATSLSPSPALGQSRAGGHFRGVSVWESLGLSVCHRQPEGDGEATPGLVIGMGGLCGLVSRSYANDCPVAASEGVSRQACSSGRCPSGACSFCAGEVQAAGPHFLRKPQLS